MLSPRLLALGVLALLPPPVGIQAQASGPTVRMVVDRVEEEIAAIEVEGTIRELPLKMLPTGTREGAVIRVVHGPGSLLEVDPAATRRAYVSAVQFQARLRPGPRGNLRL